MPRKSTEKTPVDQVHVVERRLWLREQSKAGKEITDQTPVEVTPDRVRPLTLREEMRRFIAQEVSMTAQQHGEETFEEADDFEIDDDEDFTTGYTLQELTPEPGTLANDLEGEPTPEDIAAAQQAASESAQQGTSVPENIQALQEAVTGLTEEDAKALLSALSKE